MLLGWTGIAGAPHCNGLLGSIFKMTKNNRKRLHWKAHRCFEACDFEAAEQRGLELLEIAQHTQDTLYQAEALLIVGKSQQKLGQYRKSRDTFGEMLVLSQDLDGLQAVRGWALNGIGIAHYRLGEHKTALEYFKKRLKFAEALNDKPGVGLANANIGLAHAGMGYYKEAIKHYRKDLVCSEERGDQSAIGIALGNIGAAHAGMGEYARAIEYHQQNLCIKQQRGDRAGQGIAHSNLGTCYVHLGRHREAMECYEKDLDIATELGDRLGQGRANGNIGCAHCVKGEYKTAIKYHETQLEIAIELDDKLGQGCAHDNFGCAHKSLGEFKSAIASFQRRLSIAKKLGIKPCQNLAYDNLGQTFIEMGDLKRAARNFKLALKIARELENDLMRRSAHSGLGTACLRMGKHEKALGHHQEELRIALQLDHSPSLALAHSGLGCARMELGQYATAIEHHEKDREISEALDSRPGLKRAHGNLGDVYRRAGQCEMAIGHHQEYLKMARQLEDKPAQARAEASLGMERFRLGHHALAFGHFTEFKHILNDIEKELSEGQLRRHLAGFVEKYAVYMDARVMAAAQAGDMLEALVAEEWRRCRSELPYLVRGGGASARAVRSIAGEKGDEAGVSAERLENIAKSVDASFIIVFKVYEGSLLTWVLSGETGKLVYHRLVDVEDQACDLEEWVEKATFTEWNQWQRALNMARRCIRRKTRNGRPMAMRNLRKIVRNKFPTGMPDGFDEELWESIRDPRTLESTVSGKSDAMVELKRHYFQEADLALDLLSDMLCKPILDNCPAVRSLFSDNSRRTKPIYFVPDSALSSVPFCALKIKEKDDDDCYFLIKKALIAQASSLRTLDYARRRWDIISSSSSRTGPQSPPETLVVSCDNSGEWQCLWEYFEEFNEILPTNTLSDGDMSKKETIVEQVTSGSASMIYFFGHGTSENRQKNWAAIYLADGKLLSAYELHERFAKRRLKDSRTRLMVLCACSSGRGLHASEGVRGFARTALVGGIPCLLASKWNIPTKESLILMTRFYVFMVSNKDRYQTVAEALQDAFVSLIPDRDMKYGVSFYYWAAFIPYGFANVRLDDALLEEIRSRLETLEQKYTPAAHSGRDDESLETSMMTLTRSAYCRLADAEQTMSREWCDLALQRWKNSGL